jgi:hypothetical protein
MTSHMGPLDHLQATLQLEAPPQHQLTVDSSAWNVVPSPNLHVTSAFPVRSLWWPSPLWGLLEHLLKNHPSNSSSSWPVPPSTIPMWWLSEYTPLSAVNVWLVPCLLMTSLYPRRQAAWEEAFPLVLFHIRSVQKTVEQVTVIKGVRMDAWTDEHKPP